MLLFFVLISFSSLANAESMKGFLLYEDQKQDICNKPQCWNSLTLKKKMYKTEKSMKDFTICFRINLLSYRGKSREHAIFSAKSNKYVTNAGSNLNWTTGFHYELTPVDGLGPVHSEDAIAKTLGNGVLTVQTFNDKIQNVIANAGSYTIWPIYDREVNANEWNSFCFGSSLKSRYISLTRNGKIVTKFPQPKVWADLNVGLDTSALEPLKVDDMIIVFDIKWIIYLRFLV